MRAFSRETLAVFPPLLQRLSVQVKIWAAVIIRKPNTCGCKTDCWLQTLGRSADCHFAEREGVRMEEILTQAQ